jgi:hypothetical protein
MAFRELACTCGVPSACVFCLSFVKEPPKNWDGKYADLWRRAHSLMVHCRGNHRTDDDVCL